MTMSGVHNFLKERVNKEMGLLNISHVHKGNERTIDPIDPVDIHQLFAAKI
jgi:hypothetical protein